MLPVEFYVLVLWFHNFEIGSKMCLSHDHVIFDSPCKLQIGGAPLIFLEILFLEVCHRSSVQVLRTGGPPHRLCRQRNVSMIQGMVAIPRMQSFKTSLLFRKGFTSPPFVLVEPWILVEFRKSMRIIHTVYLCSQEEVLLIEGKGILGIAEDGWLGLFIFESKSIVFTGSMDCFLFGNIVYALFGNETPSFFDL